MWNPFSRNAEPSPAPPVPEVEPDNSIDAETSGRIGPSGVEAVGTSFDGPIAEVESMGQVAIATLTVTELTQEAGAEELATLLDELAETGALHFVLDMQNVQYMDTACLGCLVAALNNLADHGGRIALANPNHGVHYVFRLTRLDRVFRICSNVMAAIEAVEELHEAD